MALLKVYDTLTKIERTVTQKAFDIITKNKKKPRYELLAYLDGDGTETPAQLSVPEKKTEVLSSQEKGAEPAVAEGITIIRKKPKQNAQ